MTRDTPILPSAADLWHAFVGNRLAWVMLYATGGASIAAFGLGPLAVLIGIHAFIAVASIGVFRFREQWLLARHEELTEQLRDTRVMLAETGDRAMSVGARASLEEAIRTSHERTVLLEAQRDHAIQLAAEITEAALDALVHDGDVERFEQWRTGINELRRQAKHAPVESAAPAGDLDPPSTAAGNSLPESQPIPIASPDNDGSESATITPTAFGFPRIAPVTSRPLYPQPLFITPADIPERPEDQRRTRRLSQEMLECNLGEVMDLSLGGVRIRTSRGAVPTEGGEVDVRFDSAEPPLTIRGIVVRATRLGPRRVELGVRFIDVPPDVQRQLSRLSMNHRKRLTFAAA